MKDKELNSYFLCVQQVLGNIISLRVSMQLHDKFLLLLKSKIGCRKTLLVYNILIKRHCQDLVSAM